MPRTLPSINHTATQCNALHRTPTNFNTLQHTAMPGSLPSITLPSIHHRLFHLRITSSPHHLITSSHHHLITSSPLHLITSSPHHLIKSSQHQIITTSQHQNINITKSTLPSINHQLFHLLITASQQHNITTSPRSQGRSDFKYCNLQI